MPMSIGEVARASGFTTSALRYYEEIGLLPAPARVSGRRSYHADVVDRLRVIALDFPLEEIRALLDGFPAATPASERWRATAQAQIAQLEARAADIERMLGLLRHLVTDCQCADLASCARSWTERGDS